VRTLLLLLALIALAACGGSDSDSDSDGSDENVPDELVGVIVTVEGEAGEDIESFTLEAAGESYAIHIAPDVDYGFDLSHLHEHDSTGDPVRCVLEEREGRLYALEILDAPVP
jgi:hypothetical protein